jgi:hypothetical protein
LYELLSTRTTALNLEEVSFWVVGVSTNSTL